MNKYLRHGVTVFNGLRVIKRNVITGLPAATAEITLAARQIYIKECNYRASVDKYAHLSYVRDVMRFFSLTFRSSQIRLIWAGFLIVTLSSPSNSTLPKCRTAETIENISSISSDLI